MRLAFPALLDESVGAGGYIHSQAIVSRKSSIGSDVRQFSKKIAGRAMVCTSVLTVAPREITFGNCNIGTAFYCSNGVLFWEGMCVEGLILIFLLLVSSFDEGIVIEFGVQIPRPVPSTCVYQKIMSDRFLSVGNVPMSSVLCKRRFSS